MYLLQILERCCYINIGSLCDIYKFTVKNLVDSPKHLVKELFWREIERSYIMWEWIFLEFYVLICVWLCFDFMCLYVLLLRRNRRWIAAAYLAAVVILSVGTPLHRTPMITKLTPYRYTPEKCKSHKLIKVQWFFAHKRCESAIIKLVIYFHWRIETHLFRKPFLCSHSYSSRTAFIDLNLYWIKGTLLFVLVSGYVCY